MTTPRTTGCVWTGLLPVDKPVGPTSHDVVARARRALGTRAIGHLGTLDPGASGLLVLLVGPATRCARVWQGGEKLYEGRARFGLVTDSQDGSGRVLEDRDARPTEADVRAAAVALTGELLQVPPMVSALKVGGRRLHELARNGETVERAPRAVRVAAWEWLAFEGREAAFRVRCSGGTYVRTLVHDLGARLGCGAALIALRRLASAPFSLAGACPHERLEPLGADEALARHGVPLDRALEVLPAIALDAAGEIALGHGRPVAVPAAAAPATAPGAGAPWVVLRDAQGRALALGELAAAEAPGGAALVRPQVVFPWAVRAGRAA